MYKIINILAIAAGSIASSSDVFGIESSVSSAEDKIFFDQGASSLPDKYPAAYNAPAHFDTFTKESWQGSFIFWAVTQDYMDVARSSSQPNNQTLTSVAFQPIFNLQPGFKIAVSSELYKSLPDGWVIDVVYTRLHYQILQSRNAPAEQTWTANNWFISPPSGATRFTSKWKMHLDIMEEFLNRPFYLGQKLIVNPCIGFRLLWLSQAFRVNFFNAENARAYSINYSRFESVGMYLGLKNRWLLGKGVYFEGDIATSFLSISRQKISHRELGSYGGIPNPAGSHCTFQMPCSTAQAGLGFGWGTYLNAKGQDNKYIKGYIDISMRMDWMILWEQNLMRKWVGQLAGLANAAGDLNIDGFTFTGRLFF